MDIKQTSKWTETGLICLSGARKVVKKDNGFEVQYDNSTYVITDNLYQQLCDANEEAINEKWKGNHTVIVAGALKDDTEIDWVICTDGGAIDAKMLGRHGDPASEASDPHEGMVQGYDGEWRWL